MRTQLQINADRFAAAARRSIGEELRRLREDAGLSKSVVTELAGIDRTYLAKVEDGASGASFEVIWRLAAALGADPSLRLFPNTGPRIRDRFQAPMIEALLTGTSPQFDRHPEVAVYRPVRGIIDLVLAIPLMGRIIAIEAQSDVRRLEQQLRWAAQKEDALPSAAIWPALTAAGVVATTSRVLVLRSTARTRELARQFSATFAAAYPANPARVLEALADPTLAWPGNGLLWARVEGGAAMILRGTPRGVPRG